MNNSSFSEDESIDSAFARFNTIITSLKALDEGYSSKNYVRKFLRALHPKWRAKVTAIEESKDLTSLSLDELIESQNAKIKSSYWRMSKATERQEQEHSSIIGGSWNDSGEENDEKIQNETCLVAQAPNEKMTERELKDKLSTLEKNKGVDIDCAKCHTLKIENEKLKEESTRLNKFEKSTHCLNEMLNNQKPSGDKLGLGFNSFEASSSGTKEIKFVKSGKKASPDGGPINMGGPHNVQAAHKINMGPPPATHAYNGGNVIFGSNLRGNIIGKGQIVIIRVSNFSHELDSEITKDGKVIEPKNVNEALGDESLLVAA
ncbi:hypothetical protein Tco_0742506 [Tanacetum coccineum]